MKKIAHPLAVLTLALAASGCGGLVKFETHGFASTGGDKGAGVPAGGVPYDEKEAEQRVLATYKAWTFESCKDAECVLAFRKKAGIEQYTDKGGYVFEYNPRRTMKNPDPEWLPGWDKLTKDEHSNDADKVYSALVLAASMKSWNARCTKDYAEVHDELTARDAAMAASIKKAKSAPGAYGRIRALLDLRKAQKPEGGLKGQLADFVGGRLALEDAVREEFFASGRDYLYFLQDHEPGRDVIERIRPRQSREKERDLYCAAALRRGTWKTPEPTQHGSSYFEHAAGAVKMPFTPEKLKELEHVDDELAKAASKRFTTDKQFKAVGYGTVAEGKGEIAGHPKLARVDLGSDMPVKAVRKDGAKTVVEMSQHAEREFDYDCFFTREITGIDSRGQFTHREICKTGKATSDRSAVVTFAELPEGVEIRVGDVIEFYGLVQRAEQKDVVKTKAVEKTREELVFEGVHLESIARDKKQVAGFFR